MDDQQTYLLNGLLARHFDLGRISRFRSVTRGRQAQTLEVLTSEHHEYLVYLYPPAFTHEQLNFAAAAINTLDENRFSVVPMLPVKDDSGRGAQTFTAEGPQGATMLVSLAAPGSALPPDQYTDHDVSQLGLRLAWLHGLLAEQLPTPAAQQPLAARLAAALADLESRRHLPNIPQSILDAFLPLLNLPAPEGWVHGDVQPAALLLDHDHQIRTLLDFALLHHGSPLEDLVDAFLHFCLPVQIGGDPISRARHLFESYDSLRPLKQTAWTPIVARWTATRLLDAAAGLRPLPNNFSKFLTAPERLATTLASCLG